MRALIVLLFSFSLFSIPLHLTNPKNYIKVFEHKQEQQRARFKRGEIVQVHSLKKRVSKYKNKAAIITNRIFKKNKQTFSYDLKIDDNVELTQVPESELQKAHLVKLKTSNSAAENNHILNESFKYATAHPNTVLALPEGEFTIGSPSPNKDYMLLPSNTSIVGHKTSLEIDDTAYWFGLATGPNPEDGVQNLTITGIDFVAKDLSKGSHFMIMADHGNNWHVFKNRFTMVHKKSSHIFDLGSVQNSIFEKNQFIGYAPELINISHLDFSKASHDFYSEAIQFDAAEKTGMWDAGLIKAIDPHYESNNSTRHLCQNIKVTNNAFLPYVDKHGIIKAYGASIGQHSSDARKIMITHNRFVSSLVSLFKSNNWLMSPIHFSPNSSISASHNFFSK